MAQNGHCTNGKMDPPKKPRVTDTELELFDAVFPTLVDDLTKSKVAEIADANDWFRRVCEYNVPFGKKNRGMMVGTALRLLRPDASEDELHRARVLGWCIEWLQAYFLVADDVMDQSVTRRGQPCWYKVKGVGLEAVNDALYLENAIFILLKKYFRSQTYYTDLLELFHQTSLQTITGQCLDMCTAPTDRVDFSQYSLERYRTIVKYKTAFYSFYLPVACAMYMAGITDESTHNSAKIILLKMGEFFQIQDDYLDCYGDPAVTGKVGTDIEDNKCSWLCVQALRRATPGQRTVLENNYAQHDAEKVQRVKALFDELQLKQVYSDYEEESYCELTQLIEQLSDDINGGESPQVPKQIFLQFAQKIYKRNK